MAVARGCDEETRREGWGASSHGDKGQAGLQPRSCLGLGQARAGHAWKENCCENSDQEPRSVLVWDGIVDLLPSGWHGAVFWI